MLGSLRSARSCSNPPYRCRSARAASAGCPATASTTSVSFPTRRCPATTPTTRSPPSGPGTESSAGSAAPTSAAPASSPSAPSTSRTTATRCAASSTASPTTTPRTVSSSRWRTSLCRCRRGSPRWRRTDASDFVGRCSRAATRQRPTTCLWHPSRSSSAVAWTGSSRSSGCSSRPPTPSWRDSPWCPATTPTTRTGRSSSMSVTGGCWRGPGCPRGRSSCSRSPTCGSAS